MAHSLRKAISQHLTTTEVISPLLQHSVVSYQLICNHYRFIVYQSDESDNQEIYLVSVSGGTPRRLTDNQARDADPVFSPDGQWIVFETNRDGQYELYAVDTEGSRLTNLTRSPNDDWVPWFSPDGQWILFQSERYGSQDIFRLRFAP